MNRETFCDAVSIMCKALPCQGQADRVFALYRFFGEKPLDRIEKTANLAAEESESFPTPARFRAFYARTAQADKIDLPHIDKKLGDVELAQRIAEKPERYYRGVLCFLGGDDSEENISRRPVPLQRIARMAKEMIGRGEEARIKADRLSFLRVAVGKELEEIERRRGAK